LRGGWLYFLDFGALVALRHMALITLLNAQLAFGDVALLDHADFSLEAGERVGLIGRNGTGKSSMLKILGGLEKPDDGVLQRQQGLRSAYVPQEPALDPSATVFIAACAGFSELQGLIDEYSAVHDDTDLHKLQEQIEHLGGWDWQRRVDETLTRLKLDPDALIGTLSGGGKKRVALAQALATAPDVLLLDEPTNHLDLDSIGWLEDLLTNFKGAVVVISHDRAFLDAVSTRIVELDRGVLRSYPGNFAAYQLQKEEQLAQEAVITAKADKLLAQEEVWVRKGVEARRTRAQGRITRLERLRATRAARRDTLGRVKLEVDAGLPSGKIVAELKHVSKSFGGKQVVKDFSAVLLRGDKVGLVGPNGAGKTTLLKLILGELAPDSGSVRQGSKIEVAYFDQLRENLNLDATLADFISPGSEWIEIGSQRKHVKSYLSDFLFSPARANSPVRTLSGGERNRLFLARLFARPANVLVLDEPTNDLDIDTLELLEELLQAFDGTVFLVSHDRAFLNNVATSIIAAEGDGVWREFEGDVNDWLLQRERSAAIASKNSPQPAKNMREQLSNTEQVRLPTTPVKTKKLSYKDQRELDALPARIEALEAEQARVRRELADPALYTRDPQAAPQLHQRDAQIEAELLGVLERWEALSG
jgi:ABC transport system ATP-binding/permease protein